MDSKLPYKCWRRFKPQPAGGCPPLKRLQTLPFEDLEFAQVDLHRQLRRGFPEVVFGEGKSPEQILPIAECSWALTTFWSPGSPTEQLASPRPAFTANPSRPSP